MVQPRSPGAAVASHICTTVWVTPLPVQCATGMKKGEAYVKHLISSYVAEYGIVAYFAIMDGAWCESE